MRSSSHSGDRRAPATSERCLIVARASEPLELLSLGVTDHLDIDHLRSDVEKHALSGGIVSAIAQASQLVLTLAYTAALARLLSPRDFGLVAMATVVVGFLQVLKEAGLSTATIQREKITHAQVSNLFWLNLSVSGAASVVMVALAPLTAWFFRQRELVGVSVALSISFLFEGLAVQHMAVLNRQMQFKLVSAVDV